MLSLTNLVILITNSLDCFTFAALKSTRNIILFTAGLFLLLHSFVPHHHVDRDPGSESVRNEAEEVVDLLSLIFRTDLGEHHLENSVVSDFEFTFEFPKFDSHICPIRFCESIVFFCSEQPTSSGDQYAAGERGPPFMIFAFS